jgi:putative endonuclease
VEHDRRSLGAHGEELAARWYAGQGYAVLARNWRSRQGELDVVAGRPGLIVFCEVKARTTPRLGSGAEAVTATKQARLRRLAAEWLALRSGGPVDVRFDVAVVHRGVELEVVEGAF